MARKIGLKDLHIAEVITNTPTAYETTEPVKLFKAITGSVSVKRTSEDLYSDDMVEDVVTALDVVEVEFTGDALAFANFATLFGAKYENGMLIESATDLPKEVALGFRTKDSSGKYEFTWLYCGKLGLEDSESYETQGKTPVSQQKSVRGQFFSRQKDGVYRIRVNEAELMAEHTEAKAAIESWFEQVQEPLA